MICCMIRAATVHDVAEFRAMIREIAEYERVVQPARVPAAAHQTPAS
jgi:hypothetical protein